MYSLKSENYETKTKTIVRTSKLAKLLGADQKIVQNGLLKMKRNDEEQSKKISMRDFDIVRKNSYIA